MESKPSFVAEIDSEMQDDTLKHDIRIGMNMSDPEVHSCGECLKAYAYTIAAAIVDLLPTKDMVADAGAGNAIYTSCDVELDASLRPDWQNFESTGIPKAVSRVSKG